uniref:WD repeat domain 54 n=1 Tax=Cyprinus carpio TaxID=7962 RepID=A0A8C1M633_CYPCA
QRVGDLQQPERPAHRAALSQLVSINTVNVFFQFFFFFTSFNYGELGFDYCVPVRHCLLNVPAKAVFARGIAAVREKYICVGVSSGSVLVFDVPSKGSNIILSEVLEEHKEAITDMASECSGNLCIADLVSADDSGLLCVWKSGEDFHLLNKILVLSICSSVKLWKGTVIAGYGTGQIRLYEGVTGILHAEVNAQARWIYSLDFAPFTGLLISAAEDSWVRVWLVSLTPETNSVEVNALTDKYSTLPIKSLWSVRLF